MSPSAPPYELPFESLPVSGRIEQLVILLHGWASEPAAMSPLADALRACFPQAALLAPRGPLAADAGRRGRQWYSIEGIGERAVWATRVGAVVHELGPWLRAQQQRLGAAPAATALAGFSQGGILSLALALHDDGIAGRVLAFGACLVQPPAAAPKGTTIHLFHGSDDRVIPAAGSRRALEQLAALGGAATLDIAEGIGHHLHPALIDCALARLGDCALARLGDCALARLGSHIPQRTWREALGAAGAASAVQRAVDE